MVVEEIKKLEAPLDKPIKAKIVRILKGKVKELINIDNIRNPQLKERYQQQAEKDAVMLELAVENTVIRRVLPISLRSNSRYFRLLKKYKKLEVGDEIEVTVSKTGRIQIIYD